MHITDLYTSVTDKIVRQLESGDVPMWLKPWKVSTRNGAGLLPINTVTGRHYHGINIPLLWGEAADKGYPTHAWVTYNQAQDKGAHVRKGERATQVVFTKKLRIKEKDTEVEKQISMLRTYWVFNVAQIDDLPERHPELPDSTFDHLAQADAFIAATHADIRHGGNDACYVPSKDYILLPPFGAFKTTEGFYATNLHELGHWTGAEARVNRDLTGRFGTRAYAAEELVAELTAAFLCAHLGIQGELRHAGYLKTWAELLKADNRAIFTAAAKAQQAADYLRAFSETIEESRDVEDHVRPEHVDGRAAA
jgi:antirestriction protein ArdC